MQIYQRLIQYSNWYNHRRRPVIHGLRRKPDDKVSGIISRINLKNVVIRRYYDAWYATTPYLLCRRGWTEWKTSERITMPKGYPDRPGLFQLFFFPMQSSARGRMYIPGHNARLIVPSPITLLVIRISAHVALASKEHGFQMIDRTSVWWSGLLEFV